MMVEGHLYSFSHKEKVYTIQPSDSTIRGIWELFGKVSSLMPSIGQAEQQIADAHWKLKEANRLKRLTKMKTQDKLPTHLNSAWWLCLVKKKSVSCLAKFESRWGALIMDVLSRRRRGSNKSKLASTQDVSDVSRLQHTNTFSVFLVNSSWCYWDQFWSVKTIAIFVSNEIGNTQKSCISQRI